MNDPWTTWATCWKGPGFPKALAPRSLPESSHDLLSFGLLAQGLVDGGLLRQARLITDSRPEFRLPLLLLLARLRQGQTRSSIEDLLALVSAAADSSESSLETSGAVGLGDALRRALPGLLRTISDFLSDLGSDPTRHAPLTGTTRQDPLPLVCVDARDGTTWFSFARHLEDTSRLEKRLAILREQSPTGLPDSRIRSILETVDPQAILHRDQREAVAFSLAHRLLLLTGGPGTGKTTVVACLLRALLEADSSLHADSIVLCAPTGRAQSRLAESVQKNLALLRSRGTPFLPRHEGLRSLRSSTIHALLGARPDGTFRHDRTRPLPYRVVVVDEVSMVDLPLFAALLDALPPFVHLVLAGDPDQLPSVEAGAVLADLVASPSHRPHVRALGHTWRNGGDIATAAQRFRQGTWSAADMRRIPSSEWSDVPHPEGSVLHVRGELVGILRSWVDRRRSEASTGRILCVTHGGPSGREGVNRICDDHLRSTTGSRGDFVPGQPVILGRNHPELDLWNGDLGVVAETNGELVVEFDTRQVRLRLLDGLESAWAITVHKSQGSEFDEVLLVLPERDTPLLSRQIAYTALTRARRGAFLWGDTTLLEIASRRREERPSRLREL
ncbi:MAG: AAA family ATPase [Fibrobacteria bacterium]|nr:AAA family ATPase [Fibrobacteria bacterium]